MTQPPQGSLKTLSLRSQFLCWEEATWYVQVSWAQQGLRRIAVCVQGSPDGSSPSLQTVPADAGGISSLTPAQTAGPWANKMPLFQPLNFGVLWSRHSVVYTMHATWLCAYVTSH